MNLRRTFFVAWLAAQSPSLQALAAELFAIQERLGLPNGFRPLAPFTRDGRKIFAIRFSNGYHESETSHEAALALLVDAWRTRVEDLATTHARIKGDRKAARKACAEIARTIRDANPRMPGEERDKLVLAAIEALESRG
jgi:hypothetical protein